MALDEDSPAASSLQDTRRASGVEHALDNNSNNPQITESAATAAPGHGHHDGNGDSTAAPAGLLEPPAGASPSPSPSPEAIASGDRVKNVQLGLGIRTLPGTNAKPAHKVLRYQP